MEEDVQGQSRQSKEGAETGRGLLQLDEKLNVGLLKCTSDLAGTNSNNPTEQAGVVLLGHYPQAVAVWSHSLHAG